MAGVILLFVVCLVVEHPLGPMSNYAILLATPCSGASAHGDRPRRAGSVSGRSETGSETGRPRGFARELHLTCLLGDWGGRPLLDGHWLRVCLPASHKVPGSQP